MGRAPVSRVRIAPDPLLSGDTLSVLVDEGDLFPRPPFSYLAWPNQSLPTAGNSERGVVTDVVQDEMTLLRAAPTVDLAGLMFASLSSLDVYLKGEDVALEHDFRDDDPPYRLTLQTPQGEIGSYGGSTGVVDDGNGFVHFSFEAVESGIWASRWESATIRAEDTLFFVEFDEIKD